MWGGAIDQTGVLGDNMTMNIHGGVVKYAPLASVTGHNPNLRIFGGLFDFSKSDQVLALGAIDLGADGAIKGSPLQTVEDLLAAAAGIDFGQDFPDFV